MSLIIASPPPPPKKQKPVDIPETEHFINVEII